MLAAVGQFCATALWKQNLEACRTLIMKAAQKEAKILFLPEASDFITETARESCQLTSEGVSAQYLSEIKRFAKEYSIWISIGLHESATNVTSAAANTAVASSVVASNDANSTDISKESLAKVFNTHWVIDNEGQVQGKYRKLHLFDVSASTLRGEEIAPLVTTPIGRVGLSVCYDLRFPELSSYLRRQGAEILTYPSAFTKLTGLAHWEVLLRARAIETQTFVVASAQYGSHNAKRASYGHAMIIDPWGKVIACCEETETPRLL
ncbi:carbon-nitrogen hydrolase [Syncephalis plumigaleata]|nr:carbon-nitrogen hydrolase [Syncephalis plumigaleata]